jgi:hypothetical protein
MEYNDTAIVITGLLNQIFTDNLIRSYSNVKNKIISTWNDAEPSLIKQLEDAGFVIKLNEYPFLKNSTNLQIANIRGGLSIAKDCGFQYIIRTRTDIFPENMTKYMELTRQMYSSRITFLCGIETEHTYFADFIVAGPIDEILRFYGKFQEPFDGRFVEKYLLETYLCCGGISMDKIRDNFNLSLKTCKENDVEFIWWRPDSWRASNRTIPMMKLIKEYCSEHFIRS